ncbi:DNA polymerase I [Burkholderiales bacterium]|nr:DNA polymerase I [Burkholderiales bacterium]
MDGSSYLYRAFHALPDLRTSRGEPTGAVRGVLSMLRRLVADRKPEYFAVVFDAPGKTFRDDWYPQYKAHRPPMPADLVAQIAPLHELIRAHGWPLLMVEGVEADDVIGTLAREAESSGMFCLVSSGDKDLTQLVTPRVTVVNTMSNETLDEAGVMTKFGVQARQMLDYLTLIGDSVDNVPGVPKVGPKTAVKWLAQFGTLEAIVAHAQEIPGVVGENLRASLDWLPQGRRLLAVKTDCTLPVHPTELLPTEPQEDLLLPLLQRFDFKSLAQEFSPRAARESRAAAADPGEDPPPRVAVNTRHYYTVLDEHALGRLVALLESAPLACFDTETTGLDPMRAQLVGLSFCVTAGEAYYLPLTHDYAGAPRQLEITHSLARLKPWLQNPEKKKLGQNAKFDQHILANHGIAVAGIAHDTLLESYVLESHKPHDMDSLAMRHLGVKTITYAEVCGKGVNQIGFEQVAIDRATEYSAEDADITLQLHEALYPRLAADARLKEVYETIELPTREVLFTMERHGVLLDAALLARQSQELGERILELEQRAHVLAGQPFNLGSPKQIQEILFNRLGLPVKKKTPTGQPSTDEDVLQELAADYPLPKLLLEHRGFSKLKSTYTDKLPQMVNPRTGRVHTHFGQATAVTGRLASSDPNLQNIPVRTPEGRRIREAFIAPPGFEIVSADYSQIELRIMAHLSGDANLTQAFIEGADIHRATAAEIFGVPLNEVSPEQRRYTKAINFGLIYGMSAFGLAAQLNIDRGAAQAYIDRYFARYPGVAEYMQRTREMARRQGYVETVLGRRLWIADINAGGGPRRQAAERAAINAPMQGTAADLVKLAMIRVQHWLERERLGSRLLLQVHDELVLEVPHGELRHVQGLLPGLMSGVATLSVPLPVAMGSGPNWEAAHGA